MMCVSLNSCSILSRIEATRKIPVRPTPSQASHVSGNPVAVNIPDRVVPTMVEINSNAVPTILGAAGVVITYGIGLWRIFNRFRGGRFIECASATTLLLVGVMAVHRIPNTPNWVVKALLPLLALFCWLSVYFGLQQVYRALRHRKSE